MREAGVGDPLLEQCRALLAAARARGLGDQDVLALMTVAPRAS